MNRSHVGVHKILLFTVISALCLQLGGCGWFHSDAADTDSVSASVESVMVQSASVDTSSESEEVQTESVSTASEVTPAPLVAESVEPTEAPAENTAPTTNGYIVAIDPGHQAPDVDMSAMEPNAPGSTIMKRKATGGTSGTWSGIGEYALNMDISLMLRDALQSEGYTVVLTREDNETAISNAERAQMANNANADIYLRIHANGSTDSSVNGAVALIGSQSNPYVGNLYDQSYTLATDVMNSYCQATGMQNLGVTTADNMTGINWSQVPVMILEMGFMTNQTDDLNMANDAYRQKMVQGIVAGIDTYFNYTPSASADADYSSLQNSISQLISTSSGGGETSVYAAKAGSTSSVLIDDHPMQAASLIKLYIAGSVYENLSSVQAFENYSGETADLLSLMISASDNSAANTLVTRLGNGDASAGMQKVNSFCSAHGYSSTSMGRLLLASNANGDNYTSVSDCAAFLNDINNGSLSGSDDILSYMKQQQRRSKIPAGVPDGVVVANKTGELSDVENDAAIVYTQSGTYILVVMSQNLSSSSAEVSLITGISGQVYDALS